MWCVAENTPAILFVQHGRVVFDGGGVEADVKVKLPKPSALEIALQVSWNGLTVVLVGGVVCRSSSPMSRDFFHCRDAIVLCRRSIEDPTSPETSAGEGGRLFIRGGRWMFTFVLSVNSSTGLLPLDHGAHFIVPEVTRAYGSGGGLPYIGEAAAIGAEYFRVVCV